LASNVPWFKLCIKLDENGLGRIFGRFFHKLIIYVVILLPTYVYTTLYILVKSSIPQGSVFFWANLADFLQKIGGCLKNQCYDQNFWRDFLSKSPKCLPFLHIDPCANVFNTNLWSRSN
jgi:hypothetical protein